MIPRYHPQINLLDILRGCLSRSRPSAASWPPVAALPQPEGRRTLFEVNSGSAALSLGLRSLRLPPGTGVGVPVYACVTVFEAIAAAGLRCEFVDLDPSTFRLDLPSLAERQSRLGAVVLIHMFGYPADIDAVRAIMGPRPIIEDCAHGLGSSDRGLPLGSRGEAAAFSFSFHKPISVGGGGWLLVNQAPLAAAVQELLDSPLCRAQSPSMKSVLRKIVTNTLYRPPWYGMLVAAKVLSLDRDGPLAATVCPQRMSPRDRTLIGRGLATLEERQRRRRLFAEELCRLAGDLPPVSRFCQLGSAWNASLWPVVLQTAGQRDESLRYFRRRGIDAFVLWPECLRAAARFGYSPGDCPRLEDALGRLMFLPCYAELTDTQQARIRQAVRQWRKEVGPAG
jgi:dTDP-4-amino-4,6-dideoxygalactose transaminase